MTDSIQSQPESTTGGTDTARPLNVAILGAGRIAQTMAKTLTMMADSPTYSAMVTPYAIASRSQDKADKFAATYHLPHAYGSYEAMLADPAVDLVYIATPHSLHAEQAIACMRAGKPVLVEKAFAANLEQARAVIDESDKTGLYCGEAIWTRYMPSRAVIDRIIDSGRIGAVTGINANLCYSMTHKARLTDPNLAGGALLDVGIYPLTFIDMVMGAQEIDHLATSMQPYPTGVDAQSTTTLYYADTTMATALSSMLCVSDRGRHLRHRPCARRPHRHARTAHRLRIRSGGKRAGDPRRQARHHRDAARGHLAHDGAARPDSRRMGPRVPIRASGLSTRAHRPPCEPCARHTLRRARTHRRTLPVPRPGNC